MISLLVSLVLCQSFVESTTKAVVPFPGTVSHY
jgi:hypothetical protein